ncbi:hypothetical protein [Nostoc sp.]|uniref:hypothetical protein n=1 Tax=Nostoc sp. TaxID=1180 RepID=UPI002FF9553E
MFSKYALCLLQTFHYYLDRLLVEDIKQNLFQTAQAINAEDLQTCHFGLLKVRQLVPGI